MYVYSFHHNKSKKEGRTMKRIFLCMLLACLIAAPCAAAEGTLRVGMECNYPPFNWTQTDSNDVTVPIESGAYCGGYDVEISKRIATDMGLDLVVVKIEWDGLIPALNSGLIDTVIAGMSPTAERKLTVDFSDAYYRSELVIVVKNDSPFAAATSLPDFAGAAITGQLNTFHYSVIDQIEGVNKLPAMETFPAMVVALSSGAIDGYVSERPGAVSAMASNPDLSFVQFAPGAGFEASDDDVAIAAAVKKGSEELLAGINAAIAKLSADDQQQLMDEAIASQPLSAE